MLDLAENAAYGLHCGILLCQNFNYELNILFSLKWGIFI
jgi:hypothetical protein